jgi:hypothetical protein
MTNLSIKNMSASVKGRLFNLAREQKRPFQELLQYYCMERFLFRLSESVYKDRFILKGALLFKVWEIADSRATLDIDTLAKTSNSLEHIIDIIKELCELTLSVDDGLVFLSDSINGEVMQLQREYEGVRIRFKALLGSARVPMQIDIGFGDIVTPFPDDIVYPVLLDLPSPKLKTYPPQTVIAEKVHTMVEKGNYNSRIKDYYDVWLLFRQPGISFSDLQLALSRTFEVRGMHFNLDVACAVIEQYAKQPQAQVLWEQLKRKELPSVDQYDSFQDLARDLLDFLAKELKKDL